MPDNPRAVATLDDVWNVLKWHAKGSNSCIFTIKRLWKKNKWVTDTSALPDLTEERIVVARESWALEKLWTLLRPEQETLDGPYSMKNEVVAVRWKDREYVIDGVHRINHWKRTSNVGPHPVLVVIPS